MEGRGFSLKTYLVVKKGTRRMKTKTFQVNIKSQMLPCTVGEIMRRRHTLPERERERVGVCGCVYVGV